VVVADLRSLLVQVADRVATYREAVSEAPVFPHSGLDTVREAIWP